MGGLYYYVNFKRRVMNSLKFHIILPYYKRQKIVWNALTSVLKSTHDNWFLTLIDDSGNRGFEDIFDSNYNFSSTNAEYIPIGMVDEEKQKLGGSIFGKFINDAIKRIESDVIIILCDDDALTHDYMKKLNEYYINNPNSLWSYCHVSFYNPNEQFYTESSDVDPTGRLNHLNSHILPIHPSNKVDSSQVTFRRKVFIDYGVGFPSPKTANLDCDVFRHAHSQIGDCSFNNIIGQCKASFPDQLGLRISNRLGEYIKL